jgi:putative DNA primase/helicase
MLARFSSWCPKAMAAIGNLPETLADRCILIHMQRKTPAEHCERLRNLDPFNFRRQCARFVLDRAERIVSARPSIPPELNDRAADIWEPLLALADLAGGTWPVKARQAAIDLSASAQQISPIASLLIDIMLLFGGEDGARIFSRDLVGNLNHMEDRPWMDSDQRHKLTEKLLANQLRPYGIQPASLRIGKTVAKGYLRADFSEAFRRYIPRAEVEAMIAQNAEAESSPPPDSPRQANGKM